MQRLLCRESSRVPLLLHSLCLEEGQDPLSPRWPPLPTLKQSTLSFLLPGYSLSFASGLKYLLGSAAQKHGVGDFVCLLLDPGKPAPHKPRAWKQSVPSLLLENEPLQDAVYFIAAVLGSEPIRSYAAMMCCVSGQHQTARRRMVPAA